MTRPPYALRGLLALAIVLGCYYHLGAVPLFDLDEGAFSEATREMLLRGDLISPYLNGVPRFDKPAFIHWLQAAGVSLLGWNEFALRLPSAVAATLWLGVVYAAVRRLRDERSALWAAFTMAASLEISVMAKAATADALLNLFITSAMLSAFLYFRLGRPAYLYATYAAMALGFLTKGPVAVVIPLATTFLFYLSERRLGDWWRAVLHPRGLVLFALIALPWYVVQYAKEGEAFIQGFFFKHNLSRFQDPMEGHSGSLFYYLPVILIGVLPYTTVLLVTLARGRAILRDPLGRYLAIWFVFVLVLFSLSGTKLPHYIVYGYTALFVLMALWGEPWPRRGWLLLPPLLLFVLLLVLPELLTAALPYVRDAFARSMLAEAAAEFSAAYRVYFALAALAMAGLMLWRPIAPRQALAAAGLATVFGLAQYVIPVVAAVQQAPIKEAALLARARAERVVMWRLNTPSFSVYSERLVARRAPRAGEVVLTKALYLADLGEVEVLYQKHGIVLARVSAVP